MMHTDELEQKHRYEVIGRADGVMSLTLSQ